jgi:hypothetical protein
MPHQFQHNQGEVNCQIPNALGQLIIAPWYCIMGSGEVVLRARESVGEPEYMVSLYLNANYSPDVPIDPMPIWFYELLNRLPQVFHTLRQATCCLDNPAVYTKVECYSCHNVQQCYC